MKLTPLQPWIAAKIGFPGGLTRPELENYQLHRLRETLALIRRASPFYRSILAGAPATLGSLQDLAQFPFTTAADLIRESMRFVCVPQDQIQRVVTLDTTGTTGTPKRLFFTLADQELTIDFFAAGMSTLVEPGQRVLILLPGQTPGSVGDLLYLGLQRLGAVPFKHGPVSNPSATLALMLSEKIDALVGVPTQAMALARSDRRGLSLKSVLLSTDYVPAAIRRVLQDVWGCQVFNHYGMTEMGLGGGVSCEAQVGYHLREADLYFEIIDPLSGTPLTDGQPGEVVFTTLTRQGMPLLRYRTGDISRFLPGPCPCGTLLKKMAWITGRLSGQIQIGDGILNMPLLDEALFAVPALLNYSASLSRQDANNLLTVEASALNPAEGFLESCRSALAALLAENSAYQSGSLRINVIEKKIRPSETASMTKRTIEDLRQYSPEFS